MFEIERTIYKVEFSVDKSGVAKAVWPDRFYLSEAVDCARHLAREGKYTKIIRERDGKEVWNSVDDN